jgi:acetolactate synthase-1/2/3 large subunit
MNFKASDKDNVTYQDIATVTGGQLSDIRSDQRKHALRGAQLLARSLQLENVNTIFGYPGGANLEIFDVLREYDILCIRTEHEQGAVHAAQGYARATGKVGVCLATSGPGATNLVTGIADANSDSTPIVAITGNVPSHLLGKNAFQEVDIVSIATPVTKKSTQIKRVVDIPEVVREAFQLAAENRPGPVLIDIPKDIQQHYPRDPEGNYVPPRMPAIIEAPELSIGGISETQLDECYRLIMEAKRPVIYAGGGVISANCSAELLRLAEYLSWPVTTTLMGKGAFPPGHRLSLDCLGMHGSKYANVAVNEADLVIALGVRFDDRVTGNVQEFIKSGKIIHIDIDRNELNKNKPVTLSICADLKVAFKQLMKVNEFRGCSEWLSYLGNLRQQFPFVVPECDLLTPQFVISQLSEISGGDAIVTTGVGQHQMWAMQHYRTRNPRSFISSSGFGTMGFGLPAAIGAKVACPERTVIDIDGDGSLNMTIHELATCHRYKVGVKVAVINNQWLGMVRQWQDMIYGGHRAGTDLSDPHCQVKSPADPDIYPDFVTIAKGYRVESERVTKKADLKAAISRMLADQKSPYLLDIIVDAEANVYPMIPAGGNYRDIILDDSDLIGTSRESQGSNI